MEDHALVGLPMFQCYTNLSNHILKPVIMRKIITLLCTLALLTGTSFAQGTRYIDEVFEGVTTITNQLYSVNVTVVTGVPAADTLLFDLYKPARY